MREIIGNTTATPNPPSDWKQIDETKADFIKNKPNLGKLAEKDAIEKNDLSTDIQESLNKANTAIQSVEGLATEDYVKEQITKIPTPDVSGQIDSHDNNTAAHNDIREAIPTLLSQLNSDETHRTVTDEEKASWNEKLDKTGGNISGNLVVAGDLTVKGTTKSEDHETILVEDNMVVLNSNKADLQTALSGVAMNKNSSSTYGAVYDPSDDTFKFGEGTLNEEKEFTFNEGEGLPFAVRDDSTQFVDGHIVRWSDDGNKLVDSGKTIDDFSAKEHEHDIEDVTGLQDTLDDKAKIGETIVDDSIAYIKDVPSTSAPYAMISEIGGMTRKCMNLIPYPYSETSKTTNGITFTINADGSIIVNGTATADARIFLKAYSYTDNIKLVKGETYTLSGYPVTGIGLGMIQIQDISYSEDYVNEGYAKTFTAQHESYYMVVKILEGKTVSNLVVYPTLNKGDTTLPYEPYFEGLRDAKVRAVESVGVNLFNTNDVIQEKAIGNNGLPYVDTAKCYSAPIKVVEGERYSYSNIAWYNFYTDDNVPSKSNHISIDSRPSSTAPKGAKFVRLSMDSANLDVVMMNRGDTAISYSPYFKNTFSIPEAVQALDGYGQGISKEYHNKIVLDPTEGVKKFVKQVSKKVLNGSETWVLYNSNMFTDCFDAISPDSSPIVHDSKFEVKIFSGASKFYVRTYGAYTVDTWKAYLAENPMTVVYQLLSPAETDISDYFGDDNLIGVEAGGTATMINEYAYSVPTVVKFYTNNNEEIASNKFIGDLYGTASRAISDENGNIIVNTYATKDELSNVSGGGSAYILPAAGVSLGGVKSGGDVTISNGVISVNDDSHNHTIANVDGLQTALDGKSSTSHTHDYFPKSGTYAPLDLNDCHIAGIYYFASETNKNTPCQYGHMLVTVSYGNTHDYTSNWISQLAFDTANQMWYRQKNNNVSWTEWKKIIDSSNIGSQSVNYANSAGSASSATSAESATNATYAGYATNDSSGNNIVNTYATKTELVNHQSVNTARNIVGIVYPQTIATPADTHALRYDSALPAANAGMFYSSNNANGIITFNKHEGLFDSQLGFNADGNIFYRCFNNTAIDESTPWKTIAYTSSKVAAATAADAADKANTATSATYSECDSSGNNIVYTYATKDELSGKVSHTITTGADANTIVTSGFYRLTENANIPGDCYYGQLIVSRGLDTITQIACSYSSGTLYTRSGNSSDVGGTGAWTGWKTIIDSGNIGSQSVNSATYALFEASTGNALIHAGNIGSQSVNYANSAGSASSATTASKCTGNAATATNVAWSGVTSKPSYYDAKAIKGITRNGTTFTYTCMDGTTGTFTQQDNNTTYTLGSFGITATAAELNYTDGVTSNIQTQLNAKQAKPSTVTGSGTISVTLVDNTEYRYTGVTKLTLAYQSDIFESWIKITVGTSANATVGFPPGTTYIGDIPTFAAGKTYEISIKDKIAVIGEVG